MGKGRGEKALELIREAETVESLIVLTSSFSIHLSKKQCVTFKELWTSTSVEMLRVWRRL